jgi:hypothetical protein
MNALKTGIHAKSLILPTEKLADLEELIEEYYRHHQPASPEARLLVDDLITCEWTLRRLGAAETQAWKYQEQESWTGPEKYPSESPPPSTPTPSLNSSTASTPPVEPSTAPSKPSNNSRPKPAQAYPPGPTQFRRGTLSVSPNPLR